MAKKYTLRNATPTQKRLLKMSFKERAEYEKKRGNKAWFGRLKNIKPRKKRGHVGEVYRGKTKYIDPEPKDERNYVVVQEDNIGVAVAKLKTIKQFDANGRNADKHLQEINQQRYGLENRTGVDSQVFSKNRRSGKALDIKDNDVFPEGKPRFKLGSHDTSRVLVHTRRKLKRKKKR